MYQIKRIRNYFNYFEDCVKCDFIIFGDSGDRLIKTTCKDFSEVEMARFVHPISLTSLSNLVDLSSDEIFKRVGCEFSRGYVRPSSVQLDYDLENLEVTTCGFAEFSTSEDFARFNYSFSYSSVLPINDDLVKELQVSKPLGYKPYIDC